MKTITKEDIKNLRTDFDKYTETAEQYQFPMLAMVDIPFRKTIERIENGTYNIEENQKDLRAMFRCVLRVIGKDFSEYVEE